MKTNSNEVSRAFIMTVHVEYLIEAPSKEIALQKSRESIIDHLQKLVKVWKEHRIVGTLEDVTDDYFRK